MAEHEHEGHRERLRGKILADACCEHEYLEMFLCYAIPRRNTNDLAHRLLSTFGCLPKVLSAPLEEIRSVKGIGDNTAALLRCMGKFCEDYANVFQCANTLPKRYERASFLSFINENYARLEKEVLDAYLMDASGKIFRRERFTSQQNRFVQVDTEAFSALLTGARPSGVILVHNHPCGEPEPSAQDDFTTRRCVDLCRLQNVILCNHLIYAPRGIYDYYGSGRLPRISESAVIGDGKRNKETGGEI